MELFAQILGYIGMVLIVTAFVFSNIKIVRIVNIFGSLLSAFFAFTLMIISKDVNSFLPTGLLNGALVIVNFVMLIVDEKKKKGKTK